MPAMLCPCLPGQLKGRLAQDDVVLKVTSTCICGSDLHIYTGAMPGGLVGRLRSTSNSSPATCRRSGLSRLNINGATTLGVAVT
jgi:hypothetical protein